MRKKDGSLDKRFKENKGLENFNLANELDELFKIQQESNAIKAEERLIEKAKNNFLNLPNSGEIIKEISELTSYFLLFSNSEDFVWKDKQKLLWFDEDYNLMSFPSKFSREVIDSFFDDGIKWDNFGSENDEKEHSIFKTKFLRFSSLINVLIELEESTILEIRKIDEQKANEELAKKPRMIERFGYCYNYDKNPIEESKFKRIKADYDTFIDALTIKINTWEYNFCLKHLTNKELNDLEEHNRIDDDFIIDDELNESIQLEKQRRKSLNSGGFIKNIFTSIFKK
ncbi:MAG: hypothetical protein ACON5K_05550 [Bacteroidia bacterium]